MKKYLTLGLVLILSASVLLVGCGSSEIEKVASKPSGDGQQTEATEEVLKVGDAIKFDNLEITVNGVRTSTGSDFEKPENGLYLIVDVTIENKGTETENVSSLMNMSLTDSESFSYSNAIFSGAKGSLDGEIGPNRKLRGEISFDVPTSEFYEFIYEDPFTSGQAIWKIENINK